MEGLTEPEMSDTDTNIYSNPNLGNRTVMNRFWLHVRNGRTKWIAYQSVQSSIFAGLGVLVQGYLTGGLILYRLARPFKPI